MISIFDNLAYKDKVPSLSVMVPFYQESPLALVRALVLNCDLPVEILLIDDGSKMPELDAEIRAQMQDQSIAMRLISSSQNEGRARARNQLQAQARGDYYLFLDADMLPDSPDFLANWFKVMSDLKPDVAFGGFSLQQASHDAPYRLHHQMAAKHDCAHAKVRRLAPEKYVFTSNLLVRSEVMQAYGFDKDFTGWGWEDVEWALRLSTQFKITHIDNTATHMGLDTPQNLMRKYAQSAVNFKLLSARHPLKVKTYASYIWARRLKALPLSGLRQVLLSRLILSRFVPLRLKALALRLWRAGLYAEVL
jgi:glycosyltransferase involved in cell wall biosynthesis